MQRARGYSAAFSSASAALRAMTAPSTGSAVRLKTMFVLPFSGLPPGKSASVLRPTITAAPIVRSRKCFRSAETVTGCVPSAPMPQSP